MLQMIKIRTKQDKHIELTPWHTLLASCGLQLRDSPELGTAVFNTPKWILLLIGLSSHFLNLWYHSGATASCDKECGEAPERNELHHPYVLFLFFHSGILYLNDDFQGGGLFFTEMDTVTVTVSLGLAKRRRED